MNLWLRKSIWINLFLGFASGLPLVLTGSTLQAWLTVANVSLVNIGFFSLVGAAYTFKFLWSPLLDRFKLPYLGRRRGWMLCMQLLIILGLLLMARQHPAQGLWGVAIVAVCVAFFSATQDISIDAYRTDLLTPVERGPGSAMMIGGYRLGVLVAGGLALMVAQYWGFRATYELMALCMCVGVVATFFSPKAPYETAAPKTLKAAIIVPFKNFLARPYALWILVFIVLYKLCDAFALSFISTFLIRGLGFDLATVGAVFKVYGVFAILLGVYLGGYFLPRLGLFRALFWFGVFQGASNALLMLLAYVGKSHVLLILSVSIDNLAAGMGTAAFLAFLMGLCDHRFTATQYALLSALSAVGRVFIGPVAGEIAQSLGWINFYFISILLMVPPLLLLCWFRTRLSFEAEAIR